MLWGKHIYYDGKTKKALFLYLNERKNILSITIHKVNNSESSGIFKQIKSFEIESYMMIIARDGLKFNDI